jgi:hypothetical protein
MSWEHIARKLSTASRTGRSSESPDLQYLEDGRFKPIKELEKQGYEMIAVIPDHVGGTLSTAIFKRFVA